MKEYCKCGDVVTREAKNLQDDSLNDLMCLQCWNWFIMYLPDEKNIGKEL